MKPKLWRPSKVVANLATKSLGSWTRWPDFAQLHHGKPCAWQPNEADTAGTRHLANDQWRPVALGNGALKAPLGPAGGHVNETKNSSLLRRENTSAQETLPLFVHIPKTAGTSIWAALGPSYSDSNRYPEVPFSCLKHNPPKEHVQRSFAVIREPCSRLASEFTWAQKLAWFDIYYRDYGVIKEFPPTCSMFNSWVRAVLARYQQSSDVEDCHMIPQWCYLSKVDEVLPLDQDLQKRLRALSPEFHSLNLPRLNADDLAQRSNVTCSCLDAWNLAAIQEHFRDDFITWHLAFGKPSPYAPESFKSGLIRRKKGCTYKKNWKRIWPKDSSVGISAEGLARAV
ncbi:Malonyl-CoA-acyl carrier protein transacylase [Durusdinium trenchii]|uniref:Mitochondrial n=1 Tax=Durusdinium trenchii TaxID=1381693 RepID=A0ABP0IB34_9DINO